jgi:anaerobic carbon-monoxide dehydrogenase iron sulfur subunit
MTGLIVDAVKCTGCMLCVLNCSFQKEKIFSPSLARLKIVRTEADGYWNFTPTVCRLCDFPACVEVCPTEALVPRPGGGALVISDLCIGCLKCTEACPEGVCQVHPDYVDPMVCDFCGGDPSCAKACPTGAITTISKGKDK